MRHVPHAIEEDDEELCEEPAESFDLFEAAGGVVSLYREVREEITATGAMIEQLRRHARGDVDGGATPEPPDTIEMEEVAPGVYEPCRR